MLVIVYLVNSHIHFHPPLYFMTILFFKFALDNMITTEQSTLHS